MAVPIASKILPDHTGKVGPSHYRNAILAYAAVLSESFYTGVLFKLKGP